MVDLMLKVLAEGRFSPAWIGYDLILSQLKAFRSKNLSGMAARSCYSDRLYNFLYEFFRASKIGSTKSYNHWRGNGVSADTNPGVSHINVAGDRSGPLIIPDVRTFQRLHEEKRIIANAFGSSPERLGAIQDLFERKKQHAATVGGRSLLLGGHSDETDLGLKGVVSRVVKGLRKLYGSQDFGGDEVLCDRWIIEDIVRSKKESILVTNLASKNRLKLEKKQAKVNEPRDDDEIKPLHKNAENSIEALKAFATRYTALLESIQALSQRVDKVHPVLKGETDSIFSAIDQLKESEAICMNNGPLLCSLLQDVDNLLLARSDIMQEYVVDMCDETVMRDIWLLKMRQLSEDGAGIGPLINRGFTRATTATQVYREAVTAAASCIPETADLCPEPVASVHKILDQPKDGRDRVEWTKQVLGFVAPLVSKKSLADFKEALASDGDLDGLEMCDQNGGRIWSQQLIAAASCVATGSTVVAELNQWGEYFFFIHMLTEFYEAGVDFINNFYQPERNPFDASKWLVFLYDWTHLFKRFVEAISLGGFGCEVNSQAWRDLAKTGHVPFFTNEWYERDTQNVAMAKEFTCEEVEEGLRALGFFKEADFCRISRRVNEAMHNNGLTYDERVARRADFLEFLKKLAIPLFYTNTPSQHVPNLPHSDRHLHGDKKVQLGDGKYDPSLRVPMQQIVNAIASLEALSILEQQVLREPGNRDDSSWPLLVHTATQQDDVEGYFNTFRVLCGPQAMGKVNHTDPVTAVQCAESLMID
ncbi:hypothetical protein HDU98_004329, partial [Podochytrium sp. JEL0797]